MDKTVTNGRMNGSGRSLGSAALFTVNACLRNETRTSGVSLSSSHRIDAVSFARAKSEAMTRRWLA